jgi:hypothetical protein
VLAPLVFNQDNKRPPVLPPLPGDEVPPATNPTKVAPAQSPPETPPAPRPRLRPADSPRPTDAPGDDLIQRFPSQNPFRGVWNLTRAASPEAPAAAATGWMIFTEGYVSMHFLEPGIGGQGVSRFQQSFRSYRVVGDELWTTSLVGIRTGEGGRPAPENGVVERRRFLFVGDSFLRIYQGARSYLELRKVEDL